MKFFISSLIISLALLSACTKSQKQEVKPEPVSIDTIPTMVMQIQKCSRLYTTEYKIRRIITHNDKKQMSGSIMSKKFTIDIPVGERQIAIPVNATLKAYVDLSSFSSDNIRKKGEKIEVVLPDPQIIMTSTKIDHDEVKQHVAMLRSNFTDEELTRFQQQGRDSIINDIPKLGLIEASRESSARTIIPILEQMGYKQENITVTFRKRFTLSDLPKLLKNGEI